MFVIVDYTCSRGFVLYLPVVSDFGSLVCVLMVHRLRAYGEFSRQCFSERPKSGEYFGRLIATGEWGVYMLSTCKVCYPQNKNIFLKIFKG